MMNTFLRMRRATTPLLMLALTAATASADVGNRGAWGDQGDGTFLNPVLPADYSDIDAIQVGNDYYAISSTLHLSPGMTILHSRDMVNWTIIGHAVDDVTQIGPEMNWDRMNRYGLGVWAGGIRHHDGKFWLYFGAPNEGLFMTTARDPRGPWEPLTKILDEPGWNDTCPFWDDDGRGYLVTTRFGRDPENGEHYNIYIFELTEDGRGLKMDTRRFLHRSSGSEANKLYKIDGTYYHYFSEVNHEGRVPMMRRARSLDGPWETRQLAHVNIPADREPNQGGLLQDPSGGWWFLTHQGNGQWDGRTMCLLPVTWIDGWPIIGEPGEDGIGNMVWRADKPIGGLPPVMPQTDDDFEGFEIGVQWNWNHQPRADKWSLDENPGYLRLHAFPPLEPGNLKRAGNTLTQRVFSAPRNEATLVIEVGGMADGQEAGLCHLGGTYSWLGLCQENGKRVLVYNDNGNRTTGPEIEVERIWLRSTWGQDAVSRFSYSLDGETFTEFGEPYRLTWGDYRGDRIGVFTYNDLGEAGYIDVDDFHYQPTRFVDEDN